MNGFLGHLCRPPEDGEMNEVTLPSKQAGLTIAPGPPPRNHRTLVLSTVHVRGLTALITGQ